AGLPPVRARTRPAPLSLHDALPIFEHARAAQIPTEIVRLGDHPDRAAWDQALAAAVGTHSPHLVVLAGFMKLVGPPLLEAFGGRSEEHTSELQSRENLVCRLLLEKK